MPRSLPRLFNRGPGLFKEAAIGASAAARGNQDALAALGLGRSEPVALLAGSLPGEGDLYGVQGFLQGLR